MITAKNRLRRKKDPITIKIGKYNPAMNPEESMKLYMTGVHPSKVIALNMDITAEPMLSKLK
jgi:hypothetical protein